ncbi:delta14-sterol reductase [Galdieria sulphuraria]|uniref:Delta(14)-sterol reductase n=1 Tax=Galdieria sulphuraria TaxID=130081 RepID=M2Y4M1_GALSU|nr:delta14-sterol reductase [Galdieria sulphuraria]EME30883.1 delta14-sterol reductase [Galdieria sulphuraria]|eukprot:XP_005707403.1 delta14-sterol reductase [Galdieria sulphuraria]
MNLIGYSLLCTFVIAILFQQLYQTKDFVVFFNLNWFPNKNTTFVAVLYILFLAVLGEILPGKTFPGSTLEDGSRLYYKCNGFSVLLSTVAMFVTCHYARVIDGTWISRHYFDLFVSANWIALCLATYLFLSHKLFGRKNWLRNRSFLSDFILGSELNPFIWKINVKFFWLRPSMIGWCLINLSHLFFQFIQHQSISARMVVYQLLTNLYIIDYFYNEVKMTTTWDIIAEHFGLMLIWGDIVFIPFVFSIQCRYLVDNFLPMKFWEWILIALCAFVGIFMFRSSNSQKHQFKHHPEAKIWGKQPETIGGKLLVSGFWGIARHINYTGDLLLALSFCLPCGYKTVIPYFYFLYLLLLLVHRDMRDEQRCANKYGALWEEYCRRVPYRLVPYFY